MTKKQIISLIVTAAFFLILIVFGIFSRKKAENNISLPPPASEKPAVTTPKNITYTPEVPKKVELTKPEEAKPIVDPVTQAPKGSLNTFTVTVSKDGYSPAEVTVKKGNVIELKLAAEGGKYDIFSPYIGFYLSAAAGETKTLSFKIDLVGTFLFECRDFCPAGKKIQGNLIVLP